MPASRSAANTVVDEPDSARDALAAPLNRGGLWDRQRLLGGKRLKSEFEENEAFILWDLAVVGEVPVEDDKTATKCELTVSKLIDPQEKFIVGTLSKAIVELAQQQRAEGDFPAVVHWEEVETKRGLQPAVVIMADAAYTA